MSGKVAIAVAAHPDDIEFMMGGTLLLLKRAGWETNYLNVSSGNCGSQKMGPEETVAVRQEEAKQAAELLEATWHEGFSNDLEILYDLDHLLPVDSLMLDQEVGYSIQEISFLRDDTNRILPTVLE